jgi:UPF0755 protein
MKKLFVIFLGIVLLLAVGGWMWWQRGTSAVNPQDKTQKMFIIQPGEGVNSIADRLKEEGLITDALVFSFIVRKEGYEKKIQAGDFRLSPSMNPQQIAETLTTGVIDIWIYSKKTFQPIMIHGAKNLFCAKGISFPIPILFRKMQQLIRLLVS